MLTYNMLGDLITQDFIQEHDTDWSQASLIVKLPHCGYLSINPEFIPQGKGIINSNRYHIYFCHPQRGTSMFYLRLDNNRKWISEDHPRFIDQEFIDYVGAEIENKNP